MPTCLYGVLGHIHRPKSMLHTQSHHRTPTLQIPPRWSWKWLTDFVCSVNQCSPLPATQDRPFYLSPCPAVYGSNALSWARPKAGNLLLAPSKSIASTPGLSRHCGECQHLPTLPPGCQCPMSKADIWTEGSCTWCLESCYLCWIPCLFVQTEGAGIVLCCCESFWHECWWCFALSMVHPY